MSLSPKKLRAARLLAAGMTRNDVADRLTITPQTLGTWERDDEAFKAEVEETANRMADQIEAVLLEGEFKAAMVIGEALEAVDKQGEIDWATRTKAAFSLLDRQGRRGRAIEKIESKSVDFKGDINELLRDALRDPGMREYLQHTVPVPLIEGIIKEAEYEIIRDDAGQDRTARDLQENVYGTTSADGGNPSTEAEAD